MRAFFEGLVLLAAVVVYFLPAIVADAREREDAFALTIFNVLFGWTVIGWVAAFVWARHRVSDKRLANLASNTRRSLGRVTIAKIVARSRRARAARRQSTLSV
ncbi:ABC-type Mn2+/Zn2+ transport system, permease component protein [Paraburkholderia caribensis MBA4]|uniref:ABC-type Mn2+/Zn2+ transport system, permease component protein n=1 Tax=Paraburkholderia caribensis MBA4 TaxID=1323664 RepID=A0A0P0RDQ1_9BURK|nr:superinfection immunity protein [Paraburkholderia caribensis]ALL66544.1 ABC-type Mn2+/Zn2+ transport system, permease component protein [Paraburkholderia caribensis MBA4]